MDRCILFVSPHREDAEVISRMLEAAGLGFEHATTVSAARARLRRRRYGAVLTAADLSDGTWKDILALSEHFGTANATVVTDVAADDRFWAEALNLGAYDVLAQPFDTCEVQRILTLACAQPSPRHHSAPGSDLASLSVTA